MLSVCAVCALPDNRRVLLEKLLKDGQSTESVGQSFRIDYDAIDEHFQAHMPPDVSHEDRIEAMLKELADMVESARVHADGENDAKNYTAYGALVKQYHEMSTKELERARKEHEATLTADALTATLVDRVLNPLLSDAVKLVVTELSRTRDELKRLGVMNENVATQFDDTTRRIGSQFQDLAETAHGNVVTTVHGEKKAKTKKNS